MNQREIKMAQYDRKTNGYKLGDIVVSREPDTYGEVGKVTKVPHGGPRFYLSGGNYTVEGVGIVLGDYMELVYPAEGGR